MNSAVKHEVRDQPRVARLVVADPHPLLRAGIKNALIQAGAGDVVGETDSPSEVVDLVNLTEPDLVLLDAGLAARADFLCLRQLRANTPRIRVVVLSSTADAPELREMFSRGASALILKTIDPADLADAITQAMKVVVFAPIGPVPLQASAVLEAGLTVRQAEVLRALSDGYSNREIAQALTISERTVKYHLSNVYRKLGVRGRADAVRWAVEREVRSPARFWTQ